MLLAQRWGRHPLALHITLRLWSCWWGNLLSLPLPNCKRLAPGPMETPKHTMRNRNGHLHAPQASPPTIPAYKLDHNRNMQPPRIHIQWMDGTKCPLTWSGTQWNTQHPKHTEDKTFRNRSLKHTTISHPYQAMNSPSPLHYQLQKDSFNQPPSLMYGFSNSRLDNTDSQIFWNKTTKMQHNTQFLIAQTAGQHPAKPPD